MDATGISTCLRICDAGSPSPACAEGKRDGDEPSLDRARRQTHRGACIYYLDKRGRRRLESECGADSARKVDSLDGIYAVVSADGAVVTVGHRRRRIFHDRKRSAYLGGPHDNLRIERDWNVPESSRHRV